MRRLVLATIASAGLLALVTGCTSSAGDPSPTTSTMTRTETVTRPPTTPVSIPPVSAGPTTAVDASSCPYLGQESAAKKVGMRLDRITVLEAGGKTVGCRFFPLQHPNAQCNAACLAAEKLPPGDQPAIEITSTRYPDAKAAHNAFVALSQQGTHVQRATISSGNVGLCFQIDFYAKDAGQDWACTYAVGATVVLVKTVVSDLSFNAVQIAKAVATKF